MVRATLSGQGGVSLGNPDLMVGVTDLEVGFVDGEAVLYAAGRGGGALTRFSLGDGSGAATLSDSWGIPDRFLQLESTDILLIPGPGGTTHVLLAGLNDDDLQGRVDTGTGLGGFTVFDAGSFDLGQISNITLSPDGTQGLASLRVGGLVELAFDGTGQISVSTPEGLGGLGTQAASAVSWVTAGGVDYAVVTYAGSDQIALFSPGGGGGLVHRDTLSPEDGIWIDSPTAVSTVQGPDGVTYVVMAASGSSSLTVMTIEGNALVPVDHVIDTLDTRFNEASQLEVMEIGGQPYVVAAGSDQGLTVFSLMPGGQLLEVATVAASLDTPLNGITDIEVVVTGAGARIFVATQGAPYLVEFVFELENPGTTRVGGAGADMLTGTGGDDLIAGGAGDDTLEGGAGDDVITDGTGLDLLTGGAGADTFVFGADGATDRVTDYQRGVDAIQLRAPAPGMGADDILVISRSWGAEIHLGTEVLEVYSADGNPLGWNDFEGGFLTTSASISVDLDDYVDDSGNTGPETGSDLGATLHFDRPDFAVTPLEEPDIGPASASGAGTGQSDLITGGLGHDVLIGAGGFDTIEGGGGHDSISGGANGDLLYGGGGNDVMLGGDGYDLIYGEAGNDMIWGGSGPDRIWGGEGNDWLTGGFNFGYTVDGVDGGAGNDTILGELGFDLLIGGDGDDWIDGGHQADNLYGDAGVDILYGNQGFDRLFGGTGDDFLYGGDGPDTHFGGGGHDQMWGGTGHDRFFGGSGNDYIVGEEGNDLMGGNSGFDTLIGGAGDDTMYGDFNADRFVFADGHGHDVIHGFDATNVLELLDFTDLSGFGVTSDVMAQAVQVGQNVMITTGADSSITLVGVSLGDIDGTDFLF